MSHYEIVCRICYKVLSNTAYDKSDVIIAKCTYSRCPYKNKYK